MGCALLWYTRMERRGEGGGAGRGVRAGLCCLRTGRGRGEGGATDNGASSPPKKEGGRSAIAAARRRSHHHTDHTATSPAASPDMTPTRDEGQVKRKLGE